MLLHEAEFTRGLNDRAVRDLETHLLGNLIRPGDADYDAAGQAWNTVYSRRPALIVRAADAADVIRSVQFAREFDLPLAIRSGGHSLAGHSTVDGGLLLDLGRMRGMSIDAARQQAWVQPGITWGGYTAQAQ